METLLAYESDASSESSLKSPIHQEESHSNQQIIKKQRQDVSNYEEFRQSQEQEDHHHLKKHQLGGTLESEEDSSIRYTSIAELPDQQQVPPEERHFRQYQNQKQESTSGDGEKIVVRRPDRMVLQAAPIVPPTAGRLSKMSTAGSITSTSLALSISNSAINCRKRPASGELLLLNNPTKDIMYQPVQGPQGSDPANSRSKNKNGSVLVNVAYDEVNFHQQRTAFQRDGIAAKPDGKGADDIVVRTTLGYSRDRLRTMIEVEKTRPVRPIDTKDSVPLVLGSDDELEYGVWGPPSREEMFEIENNVSLIRKGGIESLAPEQLAERQYIAERNRQKGIEEQKYDEESAYDRMVERKMAHLLPPVINANNNSKNGGGMEPVEPSTTFHGSEELDYKGRSWIAPPSGLGSVTVDNVPSRTSANPYYLDPEHHVCRAPKKCVHRFTGHNQGVHRIRLFPITGHLLLSAGLDGKCKVWSIPNKQVMRTYIGHAAAVRDVQFNFDGGKFLSASFDRYIRLWDTESGKVLQTFTNRKVPYVVQFFPNDDNFFVVGCSDNKIVTYDVRTAQITQEYNHHLGPVNAIVFVRDGPTTKMITSSDDKKILVWEWDIGVPIKYISDPSMHSMPCMALHPSQNFFVGQSLDNTVVVLTAGPRFAVQKKKTFSGHIVSGYACELAFSPDGQFLVSGDGTGNFFVWDWKRHRIVQKLKAHNTGQPVTSCVWHPIEPTTVFTASWDGIIKMWQ